MLLARSRLRHRPVRLLGRRRRSSSFYRLRHYRFRLKSLPALRTNNVQRLALKHQPCRTVRTDDLHSQAPTVTILPATVSLHRVYPAESSIFVFDFRYEIRVNGVNLASCRATSSPPIAISGAACSPPN